MTSGAGILSVANGEGKSSLAMALGESSEILFDVTENVLKKTGLSPQEVPLRS